MSQVFVTTVTTFIRRSQGTTPFQAGDSNLSTPRRFAARKSILSQIFSANGNTSMISTPCKMFLRQISPRIFLKMSFSSFYVQNPFFRRTLMILKIDARLGSEIKSLSTHGGTVNSCTALTPSHSEATRRDTGDKQTAKFEYFCRDGVSAVHELTVPPWVERDLISDPRQVRISGLKRCGALTSSYEGSNSRDKDRGQRRPKTME